MCHITKDTTFSVLATSSAIPSSALMRMQLPTLNKTRSRLSPFRKIAKTARINLNKYWGLLNQKQQDRKGSVSSTASSMSMDFSEEEEQNRINELLEAQSNAEEQNSINSQLEYDSTPEPPRRLFVRQRAILVSSYSTFSSSSFSSPSSPCDFDDSISQDSVFF